MKILPVFLRELRAQARQPFTFWLRVLGALLALVAVALLVLNDAKGSESFAILHLTVLLAIWALVPLSVADCVSRERRDGTLGLLFLTSLRPRDIALAKAGVHGLRAFALLLAVFPMMAIAFLQGGVGWREVMLSVSINLSWLALVIGVSVLASSRCKQWSRALLLAQVLTFAVALGAVTFKMLVVICIVNPGALTRLGTSMDSFCVEGLQYVSDAHGMWSGMANSRLASPGMVRGLMLGEAATTVVFLLVAASLILRAGRNISRRWREEPPPIWVQRTSEVLTTPKFGLAFFHRWLRRKLERNPIGWLEQRTWSGRVIMWAWTAVVVCVVSAGLGGQNLAVDFGHALNTLSWLIVATLAYLAAGSFRRERETGVLELLLVSPLTSQQIIMGRLRGLWGQFLPAFGLLLFSWVYVGLWIFVKNLEWTIYFATAFVTVPLIGLHFSLANKTAVGAFLLTLVSGVLLPRVLAALLDLLLGTHSDWLWSSERQWSAVAWACVCQVGVAMLFWNSLLWRLERRAFQFSLGMA